MHICLLLFLLQFIAVARTIRDLFADVDCVKLKKERLL